MTSLFLLFQTLPSVLLTPHNTFWQANSAIVATRHSSTNYIFLVGRSTGQSGHLRPSAPACDGESSFRCYQKHVMAILRGTSYDRAELHTCFRRLPLH